MHVSDSTTETTAADAGNNSPVFSVIIVNYNGGAYLQDALDSLARQTRRDFEVIVIDNASTDGSIDGLETGALPDFTLMAESENHGYARASNLAARRARGRWLVCLNPDAAASETWLDEIASGQARHPHAKMFASAQYDLVNPGQLDGVGDAYLIFGIPWRGGFGRPVSELPGEGECFSPCGAGAVFERAIFLEHGGFDERFFCFCEDVDLGFRLRLAGETCIFLPDAVIHHVGGGASGRVSEFALYHGARNRLWTYVKNMPAPLLIATAPGHIALSAYILLRGLMTGRAQSTWKGMADGVKGLPDLQLSDEYRVDRKVSLWRLARAMAWNPLRISRRKAHVRPLPRT